MEKEPLLSNSIESSETDPRKKDRQGLDFWAASLLRQNLISQAEYDEFVLKNNSKEEMMEERSMPQLKHYGFFTSIDQIKEKLLSYENERFIIRCTSKKNGDIKRLINASLDEACDFAEKLPGGFEQWQVEMKEFVDTKISGTIIVDPSGKTIIETWKGPHYLNTENVPKYYAKFDPEQFDSGYRWSSLKGQMIFLSIKNVQ